MSKYIPGDHKHLTLDERCSIEDSLNQGMTFEDIARNSWRRNLESISA